MSERVEIELLRRLEEMAVEHLFLARHGFEVETAEEALADIETLKLHVETLREAAQNAASEVLRLRAERDAFAGETSCIEHNVGALLDLYHARMIESEHQEKHAWERHAEKDAAYGEALAERDELRRLVVVAFRLCGGMPKMWQCSGCGSGFVGTHQSVCPSCRRRGYWTGSVDPEAKAKMAEEPLVRDAKKVFEIVLEAKP